MRSFHRLRFARIVMFVLVCGGALLTDARDATAKPVFGVMYLGGLAQAAPSAREQVSTATQVGAFTPYALLAARTDGASSLLDARPPFATPGLRSAPLGFDVPVADDTVPVRYGLGLAKPDRGTSIAMTLALCLFFFVRRML